MYFSRKMLFLSLGLLLLFFLTFAFIFTSNTQEIANNKNEAFLEEVQGVSENFYLLEKRKGEDRLNAIIATRKLQNIRKGRDLKKYIRSLINDKSISGATLESRNGTLLATLGNPGVISKEIRLQGKRRIILDTVSPTLFLTELRSLTGKEFSLWQDNQLLASTLAGQPLPEEGSKTTRDGKEYRLGYIDLDQSQLTIALENEGISWQLPQTSLILLFILLFFFLLLQIIVRRKSKEQIKLILEATKKMTQGNFQSKIPKTSSREINLLAEEMSKMGQEISSLIASLRKAKEKLESTIKKSGKAFALGPDREESLRLLLDLAIQATDAESGVIENRKRSEKYSSSLTKEAMSLADELLRETSKGATVEREYAGSYLIALPLFAFNHIIGGIALVKKDPFSDNDQQTLQYLLSQAQVALENDELHDRLKKEAATDELTGLANRRAIRSSIEQEKERALRFQRSFALMLIDVDNFKRINDQYGHIEGDLTLQEIAQTIEKSMRHIDVVARWGGEEFLILLPEATADDARGAGERLQRVIKSSLDITLSIGISSYPKDGEDIEDLILLADQAMYQAKKSGKDAIRVSE